MLLITIYNYRENLASDVLHGTFVVFCSLCVFISLVWLREQLVHGGIPAWLQNNPPVVNNAPAQPVSTIYNIYSSLCYIMVYSSSNTYVYVILWYTVLVIPMSMLYYGIQL